MRKATVATGDWIDRGTYRVRFNMIGDRYMSSTELGAVADELDRRAQAIGKTEWVVQIAHRLRLCEADATYLDALMILAAAQVSWDEICYMKS